MSPALRAAAFAASRAAARNAIAALAAYDAGQADAALLDAALALGARVTYILIDNGCDESLSHPTDTAGEIQAAQDAMRAAGLDEARVWVGDGPDAMLNGQILFAYPSVRA